MIELLSFPATFAVAIQAFAHPGTGYASQRQHAVSSAACSRQARRQGLRVRNTYRSTLVTGSGGRIIGTQTMMDVERRGLRYPVRCNYSFHDRIARITSLGPGSPHTPWPGSPALALRECIAQANRQGMAVRGTEQRGPLPGSGGSVELIVMGVTRAGMNYAVRCDYSYRERVARILYL